MYRFSKYSCRDTISYQLTAIMLILLLCGVGIHEHTFSWLSAGVVFILLELFGLAVMGFTYIISFAFPDAATAQVAMIMLNFILGFALSFVGLVLRIIPTTRRLYLGTLRYIMCLSPLCAIGDAVHNIALIDTLSLVELAPGHTYKILDYNIAGFGLMMLAWESVAYIALTIGIEYVIGLPIYQKFLNKFWIKLPEEPPRRIVEDPHQRIDYTSVPTAGAWSDMKDPDVKAEEARIANEGDKHTDTIIVEGVHKVYYKGNKHAVKGVTIGIPNGECFGLLGINGAGKTSLLSILSGEIPPTTGDVFLNGLSMSTEAHVCRKHIGFCPQFDALFELLTAR